MSARTRRPVPPCFAPIMTPLPTRGHYNVKGTDHWVSRHFDGYAVVSPAGAIVEVLPTLEAAGRVAVEYRPEPAQTT